MGAYVGIRIALGTLCNGVLTDEDGEQDKGNRIHHVQLARTLSGSRPLGEHG